MDIYTLIEQDHAAARVLIEQIFAHTTHGGRRSLFERFKEMVVTHNDAEANSFYIALEAHRSTWRLAERSRREHDEVNDLLRELSSNMLSPALWEARFYELKTALLRHMEQEEGEVFALARKKISAKMATELAVAMQQLKDMRHYLLKQAS